MDKQKNILAVKLQSIPGSNKSRRQRELVDLSEKSVRDYSYLKLDNPQQLYVIGTPFGGHIDGRDTDGETFHAETDFVLGIGDQIPVTYFHGFGPDDETEWQEPPEIIGKAVYLGIGPEGGRFHVYLDEREELARRVWNASADPAKVKASSGSINYLVRKSAGGLIDFWPVAELALFDTNDFRQPANQLAEVSRFSTVETASDSKDQEQETQEQLEFQPTLETKGETKMNEDNQDVIEETTDVVEPLKTELEALKTQVEELKAELDLPATKKEVIKSTNVIMDEKETLKKKYTDGFWNYVRTGDASQLKAVEKAYAKAALQEGTTTEGGYLVPDDEYRSIIAKRDEASIPRSMGAMALTTNRDVMNIPVEDTSLTKFSIVAEEGAITGAEEEPTFAQKVVTIYKFMKLIKVSEELLEDDNAGLEAFLADAIGRAWADTENYYSLIGTGSGQPQGVFVGGTAGLTLDSASAIGAAEIPELMYKLTQPYRTDGAAWVMNGTTEAYLRGLTGNGFQFNPTPAANTGRAMDGLMGFPVWNNSNVAAIGSTTKSLVFGNWRYYALVTNRGLRIRRLNELYAGNGQVGILASVRFGGVVLLSEAFQYATHPA